MMSDRTLTPFRFREIGNSLLVTNETGGFKSFDSGMFDRLFKTQLTAEDEASLRELGVIVDSETRWRLVSMAQQIRSKYRKETYDRALNYLIVIPTLRCNLSCSYCQVSRAPLDAKGYDWDEARLREFSEFLENVESDHIKIEIQGGEPTLRPDLIKSIIDLCENRFLHSEFVICTNLIEISDEII